MTETERKRYIASGWDMTPKKMRNYWKEDVEEQKARYPVTHNGLEVLLWIFGGCGLFAVVLIAISYFSGLFELYRLTR